MRSPYDHRLGAEGTARGGAHRPGRCSSTATARATSASWRCPPERQKVTVGRGPAADLRLAWDREVSRAHAELEQVGGAWTVSDDGLSTNGTFRNDERVRGRHPPQGRRPAALRQDARRVPRAGGHRGRHDVPPGGDPEPPDHGQTQHNVLIALCRPLRDNPYATPATNSQISSEMHLGVDAIKVHLRSLYRRLGIETLPAEREAGAAGGARDPSRSDQRARSSTASRPRGRTGRCRSPRSPSRT